MHSIRKTLGAFAFAGALLVTTAAAPVAQAAPGTCKCNSGCHATPGQCVKGAACNIGYAATCGYRGADSGTSDCPKVGFISCNGTCTCDPIPGFCETIGGAEFCDAGPEPTPDTSVPDTFVPDTFVPDTAMPDTAMPDTAVTDTLVPADTFVPDTTPPPDTFVPDTDPPPDTFVPPDADPPDSCVPLECPPGTKAIVIPGECDPFCSQPCGSGEFKCSGLVGTECKEGFCVPKCLTTGCPDCKKCSLGDGTCFDDPTACDGGVPDGFVADGSTSGDGSTTGDGTVVEDSSINPGADTGATGDLDGSIADTGEVFGTPVDETLDTGGCGCAVPGNSSDTTLMTLAGAAALAMVVARRRRK